MNIQYDNNSKKQNEEQSISSLLRRTIYLVTHILLFCGSGEGLGPPNAPFSLLLILSRKQQPQR